MARVGQATLPRVVLDRWGRRVAVTEDTMKHVTRNHREWATEVLTIATAIERAGIRTRGKKDGREIPDREVLWVESYGRGRWYRVVVRYDGVRGRVITAYAGNKGPEDADRI